MTIIHPDDHRQYFDGIKSKLYEAPLTIAELTCLQSIVGDLLKAEWEQHHLFTIGDRQRENIRNQFFVLSQAFELSGIAVARVRPERDNGDLKWNIYQRSLDVFAMLVLRGTDDTWTIEPMPMTDRRRSIMTAKQTQDTLKFNNFSLAVMLRVYEVDLAGLGGWKVAR